MADCGVDEFVAGHHDVAPSQLERIQVEAKRQLIECGLHREDHLAQAVSAERPGRNVVGVDRLGVDPLVGAPVHRHRFRTSVEHHAGAVVAIGAGVGEHVDGQGRQDTVGPGGRGDVDPERMPARRHRELVGQENS